MSVPAKRRVLLDTQVQGFSRYKYSCIDTSPLSKYVMQPFWDWFVALLPLWLAPNIMTFVGFLLELLNYFVLAYYDWDFQRLPGEPVDSEKIPRWVWLLCAFVHFLAHTLDGADGKQARRTGSSSPLGELFDHGLDSMAVWLMVTAVATPLGLGRNIWAVYLVVSGITMGFFFTHWEKYNTGVLFLPWSYDASQLLIVGVYLVTYWNGVVYWSTPFAADFPFAPLAAMSVLDVMERLTWVAILAQPLQSLYLVLTSGRPHRGHRFVTPLIPYALLFGGLTWWVQAQPELLEKHLRLVLLLMGLVFSNESCRLIVDQMSDHPHRIANVLVLGVPLAAASSVWCDVNAEALLYVFIGVATTTHVWYGWAVVRDLCDALKIRCFHIKVKKGAASRK